MPQRGSLWQRIYARLTRPVPGPRPSPPMTAPRPVCGAAAGRRGAELEGQYRHAGIPTEAGSRLLAGARPKTTPPFLPARRWTGWSVLARPRDGTGVFRAGLNPMTATPPNSIDPALAPGSSSGRRSRSRWGWRRRRSGRIPAARCGCRRRGTACRLQADTMAQSAMPVWCRCAGASTWPAPSPAPSRTAPRSLPSCAATRPPTLATPRIRGRRLMVLDGVPFDNARPAPSPPSRPPWTGWRRRGRGSPAPCAPACPRRWRWRRRCSRLGLRQAGPDRGRARADVSADPGTLSRRCHRWPPITSPAGKA